ncbi:MAG: MFS transporter [Planctomycetes bacterium]|nr:MFS transporter [Planctomycetota bacterium]
MSGNILTLLVVSALFGLSFGVYELALPFFLKAHGISLTSMGYIFAVPALFVCLIRVGAGWWSDFTGRKGFYAAALAVSALANLCTPFLPAVAFQIVLKSVRESTVEVRKTMHALVLFESARAKFLDLIGKTTSAEYLFMGLGALGAGYWLHHLATGQGQPEHSALLLSAAILATAFLLFALFFQEPERAAPRDDAPPRPSLFSLGLDRRLNIIIVSTFIFNIGLWCTHCQVMPLFFTDKFGATRSEVGWIMAVHRFTVALPMALVGLMVKRRLKLFYVLFMALEGLTLVASALIPTFWPATIVWLLHDLVGAGIWVPIQSTLIQQYARENSRGADVAKAMAIAAIGSIFGPILAGYLYPISVDLPFIVGGGIIALSALILLPL